MQNAELVKFPKIFVYFAQLSLKKWTNLCAFLPIDKKCFMQTQQKIKKI